MPSKVTEVINGERPSAKKQQHRRQGLAPLRDNVGVSEETWPYLVSAVAGIAGVAVAASVGAAEIAVGVVAAYVAYDVIARGVPLWDAIGQAEKEVEP